MKKIHNNDIHEEGGYLVINHLLDSFLQTIYKWLVDHVNHSIHFDTIFF